MPSFSQYTEVEVDIDIEVGDFIDECSDREIQRMIKILRKEGYLSPNDGVPGEDNLLDIEYKNALDKLYNRRIYLTLEEEQFIKQLANRF
jgi:hypothetical protein